MSQINKTASAEKKSSTRRPHSLKLFSCYLVAQILATRERLVDARAQTLSGALSAVRVHFSNRGTPISVLGLAHLGFFPRSLGGSMFGSCCCSPVLASLKLPKPFLFVLTFSFFVFFFLFPLFFSLL